ncbi:MAG: hypothetical protein L0H73_13650 [Nitrococcus sp.]|nr:hypothetical protein [Nitrococcus sp.]
MPAYDRGGLLVRPVRAASLAPSDGIRRGADAITLRPIVAEWLRLRLAGCARWERQTPKGEYVPVDPPAAIARTLVTCPDLGGWPCLRAVARHPVLTPEGRLIGARGYDPETRLLIDTPWAQMSLPEPLDRGGAEAAVGRLRHLLRYYPWASADDEAVALSLLLTALARPVLPAAPMHAADAPAAGTGKSLLVDVAAILATGERAAVMDWGADPTEAGKRLDAMLLAGDPVIALDNVEAPLTGGGLCQTLTQTTRRIRPLGTSILATTPCTPLIAATGNNLTIPGDMVRRTLVCRLDAGTDAPERRAIPQDLLAEVAARRREIIVDCLTIMAAYIRAGGPDVGTGSLGSYEAWSRMVRDALIWAGCADPAVVIERARADDPTRQALAAVLTEWRRVYGDEGVTARTAIDTVDDHLRAALELVALRRGELESRALGYWLRGHRDSRSGALVLRSEPGRAGVHAWRVERAIRAVDTENPTGTQSSRRCSDHRNHDNHRNHGADRERGGV